MHTPHLVNEQPQGFATNHNTVMRLATTLYTALLNDDVEIPPAMLDILIDYMEAHTTTGLVSPLVLNPDKTPQLTAFSDPSLFRIIYKISGLGHFTRQGSWVRNWLIASSIAHRLGVASLDNRKITREVPVVVGVAMIVRRTAYLEAGLMDEDTRVYGEEIAWHWRLRQSGWRIVVVADTYITHFNVIRIYAAGIWLNIVKAC